MAFSEQSTARQMLCKVPEVTLYFWVIKIMATTVGETAADFLNFNLGLGLSATTYVVGGLFLVALVMQLARKRYVPWLYWLTVLLISVVGTLITDNLTDNMGVPLWLSTTGFSVLLALTFALWFASEKTLSIHSIFTTRRELFYWAAILVTFALGTAGGDFASEGLNLGYLPGIFIFGGLIAATAAGYYAGAVKAVPAFWIAYVLTRPLGASIGDFLIQSPVDGGIGIDMTLVNGVFFSCIILLLIYLSISRADQPVADEAGETDAFHARGRHKAPAVSPE